MQKSFKKVKKNPVYFLFFFLVFLKKTFLLTDLYDLALPKICSRPPTPPPHPPTSWSASGSEELSNVKKETRDFHTLLNISKCLPVLFLVFFSKELYLKPVLHPLVGSGGVAGSGAGVELVSAGGVV